jgi:hypothetical protein
VRQLAATFGVVRRVIPRVIRGDGGGKPRHSRNTTNAPARSTFSTAEVSQIGSSIVPLVMKCGRTSGDAFAQTNRCAFRLDVERTAPSQRDVA